jgi:hypothetical protein
MTTSLALFHENIIRVTALIHREKLSVQVLELKESSYLGVLDKGYKLLTLAFNATTYC